MKTKIFWLTACLVFSFSTSLFAMAGSPPKKKVVLPENALTAEQISAQFSGKSALAKFDVIDKTEVYYFADDGHVTEVRDGFQRNGSWFVRKDGRLCIEIEGEHKDCRMIIKDGDDFHQYAAKQDGNHRYEQTYVDFREGNQIKSLTPSPLLPQTTLSRDEVIDLFLDKTVESITASQGRVSHTYYSPDGQVIQLRDGVQRTGHWRVTNDARICLQMESLEERCRIIVKEGDEYKKYIVKKNGQHQHSVSYRNFMSGKQF